MKYGDQPGETVLVICFLNISQVFVSRSYLSAYMLDMSLAITLMVVLLIMHPGIIYAVIAAVVFGIWTFFHQQASSNVHYLFGAIVISATAAILGLFFLLPKIKETVLFSSPKGVYFAVSAGVCALILDYFVLKAYGSGLAISVAGPIIIGGSIAVSAIIGFFMGDSITLLKISAIFLILVGAGILAALSHT